jgi:hypothetical protein
VSVRIASKLPGDRDGLQSAEADLRKRREPIVVVAVLHPRSVADVLDKPDDPYLVSLGVTAVEVMLGADAMDARKLLDVEYQRRTGQVPLPLDVEYQRRTGQVPLPLDDDDES